MSDATSIICAEKLARNFKRTNALALVDLRIERGEIFGLARGLMAQARRRRCA